MLLESVTSRRTRYRSEPDRRRGQCPADLEGGGGDVLVALDVIGGDDEFQPSAAEFTFAFFNPTESSGPADRPYSAANICDRWDSGGCTERLADSGGFQDAGSGSDEQRPASTRLVMPSRDS